MKRIAVLWELVREDAVARTVAITGGCVAWFAATWVSLGIAALLPLFGVALWWRYRQVGHQLGDDVDELL